jgi:uncharacterized protein (TIGR02466 family)
MTNENVAVEGLFPTPFLKFRLGRDLTKEEREFIFNSPIRVNDYSALNSFNNSNSISTEDSIVERKELTEIKKFIDECLAKYVEIVYDPVTPFQLKITQSWLTRTKKHQSHPMHAHSNSIVSGVFYVKADNEDERIIIHNPKGHSSVGDLRLSIPCKNINAFNSLAWGMPVKTGDLILFPSLIVHEVEPVEGNEERISLPFNTFVVGSFGVSEKFTRLTIKDVGAN